MQSLDRYPIATDEQIAINREMSGNEPDDASDFADWEIEAAFALAEEETDREWDAIHADRLTPAQFAALLDGPRDFDDIPF